MDHSEDVKSGLRDRIRSSRRARALTDRELVGTALADRVTEVSGYAAARTVTAYASFGTEPSTGALLERLIADGKTVLLPIVHDDGSLGWVKYTGSDSLRFSERGIPEPVGDEIGQGATAIMNADVDLMLIPALAVDLSGSRIGKGGGFYDRVLAALPSQRPFRVAVVHDEDVLAAGDVPAEAHDQPVHAVLTPSQVILLHR